MSKITADELNKITSEADKAASGLKGSQTSQTRRAIAAMKAIGVPRREYSARVVYEYEGGYRIFGDAHVSPKTPKAGQAIIDHAEVLAAAGFHVVIINGRNAFMATSHPGSVHRIDTQACNAEGQS